jgi:cobalt-zinc-cadmium efflux system membrane fusion protein
MIRPDATTVPPAFRLAARILLAGLLAAGTGLGAPLAADAPERGMEDGHDAHGDHDGHDGTAGAPSACGPGAPCADHQDDQEGHGGHREPDDQGEYGEPGGHGEPGEHGDHGEQGERGEHGEHHGPEAAFSVADFERFGVHVVTAGPGEVDVGIELPGEVRPDADRIAHIAPPYPGIVREVRAHVGDRVRAGDVLARIQSEQLATYELKAALDGTVIDKHVTPGEAVTRERPCFVIADLSTVWVEINVYQKALPLMQVGQPVVVSASHGQPVAEGTVAYIAPVVDQATRTAGARVVLANPDGAWRPGLYVTATVFNPVAAPVVIPRRALQNVEGRLVVFVVEDDRFEPRAVTIGRTGRSKVEIVAGLLPGEEVADERSFLVKAELAKGEAGHDH